MDHRTEPPAIRCDAEYAAALDELVALIDAWELARERAARAERVSTG